MLRYLSIRRLAVIETLDVEFGPGLSILTGETGAGKSILVDAVDLLLGGRASADLVRTGADLAQVQAVIETHPGTEIVVRREVLANGRSRAFLDDTLVTTATLRDALGPHIDLHGQYDHHGLIAAAGHLDLLDRFAGLDGLRARVESAFRTYRAAQQAVDDSQLDERERTVRLELIRHQLGEIERVHPTPGEDDDLLSQRHVLANADRLDRLARELYLLLYEGDDAIIGRLAGAWKRLDDLRSLDPRFEIFSALRNTVAPALEDISLFVRDYITELDASPERLQQVEDRLAALERVKRKYGPSLDLVLQRREELLAAAASLDVTADRLAELQATLANAREGYLGLASELSEARRRRVDGFGRALVEELGQLAMEKARCELRLVSVRDLEDRWTERGVDAGELFLSANLGEEPRPLARIASGGERSRVLLAIKTLASVDAPGRTLVFDEVDAGIGGRAADAVGARLRALGSRFQVLAITHLPQVAAHGQAHYRVAKSVEQGRTLARVSLLSPEERVLELARMIGGASVTARVIDGAREMLASRDSGVPGSGDPGRAKGESERAKAKGKRSGADLSR
jgi:DNA repair protein RecN (Recombination protein N)